VTSRPVDNPEAATQRLSLWRRRPPLWLAVTIAVIAVVVMAVLRLLIFPHKVVPIAYGVPLILFVWLRHRGLLWFTVGAFTVISVIKFFVALPANDPENVSPTLRLVDFLLIQVDLVFIAAAMHWLIDARERLESRAAELKRNNAQLESINRELASREEEVARQNEELQSQTEELERQSEELRVGNAELGRRERVTETLLTLSRSLTTDLSREEMMSRVCDVLGQLIDGPFTGAAILEQDGDHLRVVCHQGFGEGGPIDQALPVDRSFASLVLGRGRTAYIEDLRQRPDLVSPQPKGGEPFMSILAAPLRAMGWPVGTVEVYRRTTGPWDDDHVALIESLAAQASISLEALRHLRQVSEERRRFETVLRTVPVGIVVVNADCTDMRMNTTGAAMFAMPADTNLISDLTLGSAQIFLNGRQITPDEWLLFQAAREGIDFRAVEMEAVLATGRRIVLLVHATPVRDAGGNLNGAVAAFVDITPLKELQRELDARRREAEENSVRKTRFLAAVSHDIRTPANAITLLAELIRRTASNPALAGEVPELAKEIHSSAMSLVELLGDVLDLARYDSGRIELQETEFSLSELLHDEHRRFTPIAREKGLSLRLAAPERSVRLRADRIKLSRVIGNLVGNAIKFTERGEVSIEAGQDGAGSGSGADGGAAAADGLAPVIRVRDTGMGIPPEMQQTIFDEFVQLHNRERDRNKGTGLGLTICKRLVDAMGGELSVQSEPGAGSTFVVKLPAQSVVP
jgi:signal transduction histidine kinase